jgi:2'-5' RNA ligase
MRLFVAIDTPKELGDYFKSLQTQLDKASAKLRLTSSFHLTLKFLGDIDEKTAEKIIRRLEKIKSNPFILKTENIGVFPNSNYVRVVWVGLSKNQELISLQKNIDNVLEEFNFKKDFDFHPHITLARVGFVSDNTKFNESIKKIKIGEKSFEVKNFILYESNLTPKGPIYKIKKEFCF